MKRNKLFIIFFLLFTIYSSLFTNLYPQKGKKEDAKPKPVTRILFVLDASGSMQARWQSDLKITIARRLFIQLLDSLKDVDNLQLALRIFGHQVPWPPGDCNDTKLEIPFGTNLKESIDNMKHKIKTIVPKGITPIAGSLEAAANDFTPCTNCRNIVILITDGQEECNGDPCAASLYLQKKGIALKPFVIGIGEDLKEGFDCVGQYFNATSEEQFHKALNIVITQALNSTSAQVNLLDQYGNPTETNVNMTFYDMHSGAMKYNFVHTLNNKGVPDTLIIDPLPTYKIVAHTIPPVTVDNIHLFGGKHTVIPMNTPQGYLILKMEGKTATTNPLQCIIRKSGTMETLNTQSFGETEKYIVGKYDAEILCLPRMIIKDIEVRQSHTTTVEIPLPGVVTIRKSANGYGSLYVEENNKLKWIYNLNENALDENLILQPGNYRIVYRSKYSNKSLYTTEKMFKIISGKSLNVKMFER